MEEQVILVDGRDREIGLADKLAAHREGLLHRAVSVFVFDCQNRLLLQQRALSKYHSAGLWSNTCCTHPRPGEDVEATAHRRLNEEMGFDCPLVPAFSFVYRAIFDNHMIEHEFDHVFFGRSDADPVRDPAEVEATQWMDLQSLQRDVAKNPQRYTAWFLICFDKVVAAIDSRVDYFS